MATWAPKGHVDVYGWAVGAYRYNTDDVRFYKILNYSDEAIKVGINVFFGDFCLINVGQWLEIGDDTAIHAHSSIIGGGTTKIGKKCSIGYYSLIVNGTDTYRKPDIFSYRPQMSSALPEKERAVKRGTIIIEDEVYIGPHCTITIPQRGPDAIRIGKGSVIGAYSYIDHDVPPDTVTHPVQITVETKRGEEGQGHPIVDLPTDLTRQLLQYLTERGFLKLAEKTSIH